MPNEDTRVKRPLSYKERLACWIVVTILKIVVIIILREECIKTPSYFPLPTNMLDPYYSQLLLRKDPICTPEECKRSSSNFRLAMDMSVNPCDDFYQYSCGNWRENRYSFSNEKINIEVEKFLEQTDREDDPLPVKQSRKFYRSCINIGEQKRLGLSAMNKYLKKGNLPLVPTFFKDPQEQIDFDWKKTDVDLKRFFDMDLFINFTVDVDPFTTTNNVMYMGMPSSVFPLERVKRPLPSNERLACWIVAIILKIVIIIIIRSHFRSLRSTNSMKCTEEECINTSSTFSLPKTMWAPYYTQLLRRKDPICTSEECKRSSSSFRSAMDMSVNPCDDFYQYSCGHWRENRNSFSKFEKINIEVEKFLEQTDSEDDPLPVKQSRKFYQSCINIGEQKRLILSAMNKYLKKANLPLVPTFFKDPQEQIDFDWKKTDVDLKRLFDMDLFINFTVDADPFNTTNNVMYMGMPSSVLPLERFSRILSIIKKVLAILSPTPIDNAMIERAVRYIRSTSSIVSTKTNLYKTHKDIKKVLVHDIQKATNKVFKRLNLNVEDIWEPYLKIMFTSIPNVTLDLKEKDLIYTTDEDLGYMHKIASVLAKTPNGNLELYAWWAAIQFMMNKIPEIFNSKSYHINFLECSKLTTKYMEAAVSYGIADKPSIKDKKSKVVQMLSDIKVVFDQKIKQITWMDESNKRLALEKNKMMMSFIRYPDQRLMEKGCVENYYENITIRSDTYLDNVMQFISSSFPSKLANLRGGHKPPCPLDHVPTAILKFPMYNLGLEVLNYGSMGSMLGHELIQAFENGRSILDQFENHAQYIQGKASLGQNIAVSGGLQTAYAAYQNYLKRHEPDEKLPGFENFTNDQMFFLAFASFHCEEMNIVFLEILPFTPHSPSQIRVLGALQNSEEFSKAFGCPKGSKMNPNRPKCLLW